MSDDRCRACGAALPVAAQWCSLCFADLRPPAPVAGPETEQREPVSVPAAAAAPASGPALDVLATPPVATQLALISVAAEPSWPCPACHEPVAMTLDACGLCGAGFLAGAATAGSARLPIVGDLSRLSRGQRLTVALATAFLVMVLLLALAAIGAKVF